VVAVSPKQQLISLRSLVFLSRRGPFSFFLKSYILDAAPPRFLSGLID